MNYYEHHIGDYDEATSHLTACEDGIYSRLIRKYYSTEKPLPNDIPALQRLVRARTREEKSAVVAVLEEFFFLEGDGWHQKRCDDDLAKFLANEPERELKKANEDNRLKRHREERAKLFKALTEAGLHAPWNTGMSELREMVAKLSATSPETLPETEVPPLPATAPATPATATQTPDTTTQTPVVKTIGSNDGIGDSKVVADFEPTAAAEVSMSLIAWERARGKVPRGIFAGDAKVQDLAAMAPTSAELRKAYDLAVADRDATGDGSPINAGFVLTMLAKVRNPPKPRPRSLGQMTDNELEAEARRVGANTHGCSRNQAIERIQAKRKQLEGVAA